MVRIEQAFTLDEDQRLCYLFIAKRLGGILNRNEESTPDINEVRTLYMGGPGGSGKSRVIRAISAFFSAKNCDNRLNISATTGIAANGIYGSTIDSLCQLPRNTTARKGNRGKEIRDDEESNSNMNLVQTRWMSCQFLIVDEVCIYLRGLCVDLRV
jgi:hypothetical protein